MRATYNTNKLVIIVYIQSELSFLCRLVALKSAKRHHDWLEQQGVTLSSEQAITIAAVADKSELRQGDLMGLPYLASEKSKVSRVVQGLVMEGYIDRRDDIHDRRSKILTLSEKGQMMADMMSQAESNNKLILSSLLSNEEMSSLQKALEKIVRAM